MPTWEEIKDYARSEYKLAEDKENWFSLVFGYEGGRSQKVWVRRFTSFDKEWVEFRSVVCKGDKIPHKVALQKNDGFSVGALALDKDDDYVFIYTAPLPTMDPEEFKLPLHVVARTADRFEADYTGEDTF